MKYQELFAALYTRPPARRGFLAVSAQELGRLSYPLWAFAERLGLPRLEPWQRKELGEADVPELRQLMLAYGQLLTARPDLARALRVTPAFVEGLRRKEVALGSLAEMLDQLLRATADARLLTVAELHHHNSRVAEATAAVAADRTLDPAERDAELAGFASARRLQEDRKAQRRRALKKIERRLEPLREQLRAYSQGAELARIATELGAPAAVRAVEPGTVPRAAESGAALRRGGGPRARWLAGDRVSQLLDGVRRGGAPLDRCLSAGVAEIEACTAEVGRMKGLLGGPPLQPEERRELGGRDRVAECNLALANAQALRSAPRVAEAAGTSADVLEEGCRQLLALDRLELGAALLMRDVLDGRVVILGMSAVLHQQAEAWLDAQLAGDLEDGERQQLLADFAGPLGIVKQAAERRSAAEARAERRVEELSAQVQAAAEEAQLKETAARLRAGEPVDAEALLRAEATRQRRRTKR